MSRTNEKLAATRVLLVEEHEVARRGLQEMLRSLPFVDLIASVASPREAAEILARNTAEIVILPYDSDFSGAEALVSIETGLRRLFLVRPGSQDRVYAPFRFPADGFVLESSLTVEILARTLLQVVEGELVPMPVELARHAFSRQRRQSLLTRREAQILDLLGEGLTNKEIAKRLGISTHGIKRHVASILTKLSCANRTAAVVTAIDMRLLSRSSLVDTHGH